MNRIVKTAIFLILPQFTYAAITFPWATTFNCSEWSSESLTQPGCDSLEWPSGTGSVDGNYTSITAAANNPAGTGNGVRFWVGDGVNVNSAVLSWNYLWGGTVPPQTELWIRWYQRYEAGFQWSFLGYDKTLYIYTEDGGTQLIPEFNGDDYVLIAQSTPDYYQVKTTFGWSEVMRGTLAEGKFHCYEIHVKMDTNSVNGIGELWIDGDLKVSNPAVNWSAGNATARLGWKHFRFHENQNSPNNGRAMYVDYDDMVIYNTTPPKRDADGNPFIGPINWSGGNAPPAPPKGLRVQ